MTSLRRWWPGALILLVGAATYANGLRGAFVFDDVSSILENPVIRTLSPWWAPTLGSSRPLTQWTFAANYALGGLDPLGYHLVNLAIHLAAGLVLMALIRRTLLLPALAGRFGAHATPLATLATLLWLVHPIQAHSVTYLSQRAEALAGLCVLLTLWCSLRAVPHNARSSAGTAGGVGGGAPAPARRRAGDGGPERGIDTNPPPPRTDAGRSRRQDPPSQRPWALGAVLAVLCGMLSKPVAVTAPLLVWLYDGVFVFDSYRAAWRARWRFYAALASAWLALAFVLATSKDYVATAGWTMASPTWWEYARSQPGVLLGYLGRVLWPIGLVLDEGWPVATAWSDMLWSFVMVGGWVIWTIRAVARRRSLGFLSAWTLIMLAPSSGAVPLRDLSMLHRMYLSLAAPAVAAAFGGWALTRRWAGAWPRVRLACAAGAVALSVSALSVLAIRRNADFASERLLWERNVALRPSSARAHNNLGVALASGGDLASAARHFKQAAQLDPAFIAACYNLGVALARSGRSEEAIAAFRQGLDVQPRDAEARNWLGALLARRGEAAEAFVEFTQVIRIDSGYAPAYDNLGRLLERRGHWELAAAFQAEADRLASEPPNP